MRYENLLTGLASLLLVAVAVTGCEDSIPSEPQVDATASLTAAPPKSIAFTAEMDLTGPIPGFPNVINPECVTIDTETGTAHFKNCIVVGSFTGDLVGAVSIKMNGWQGPAGSRVFGSGSLDVCHADFGCGAFDGPFKGEGPPGGQVLGRLNAHGTGDFHTLQIRLSVVERGNTEIFDADGVIF